MEIDVASRLSQLQCYWLRNCSIVSHKRRHTNSIDELRQLTCRGKNQECPNDRQSRRKFPQAHHFSTNGRNGGPESSGYCSHNERKEYQDTKALCKYPDDEAKEATNESTDPRYIDATSLIGKDANKRTA